MKHSVCFENSVSKQNNTENNVRTLGLTLREIHLNFEKKNIKMVRKKIDNRIRVMIENGITLGHRTMFAVVGDKAKDQVVILHHMVRTLRTREGLVSQITIVLFTDFFTTHLII